MSGVLTVARLEFKLRIRAGRWRWLVGAWFVVLALVTWLVRTAASQPNIVGDSVERERTLGAVMFGVVVLVVLALALLVAPALAAQSVNGDRERGTLATLQVTRLRAGEIAVGKLLASWGTALVFLAVTLPLALWCYTEGGLSVGRIAGVYLVTALLLGVVCAISLGLSALLARSTTSGVLAYLTVFALAAGTAITFGLVTASTQQTVTGSSRLCDGPGANCTETSYETTVARPDRTWWLLAPNPFVVLADSAPAGPVHRERLPNGQVVEVPADVDVLGSLSRELHRIRATPHRVEDQYGTAFVVPDGVTGGPVWPLGLGIDLALAAGALWLTTVRLRTPTHRLARGQRVA
ncbi:MAG TPA: ABC transporter permease subunit [Mycobacteriales bacterium]|nr:ABC transporter permease subunit [Mycobacteriales bacterium]